MNGDVIDAKPLFAAPLSFAEVIAGLEFELYVSNDQELHGLADRMARIGLDAIADFDLAAELFTLTTRDTTSSPITVLPQHHLELPRCAA